MLYEKDVGFPDSFVRCIYIGKYIGWHYDLLWAGAPAEKLREICCLYINTLLTLTNYFNLTNETALIFSSFFRIFFYLCTHTQYIRVFSCTQIELIFHSDLEWRWLNLRNNSARWFYLKNLSQSLPIKSNKIKSIDRFFLFKFLFLSFPF